MMSTQISTRFKYVLSLAAKLGSGSSGGAEDNQPGAGYHLLPDSLS